MKIIIYKILFLLSLMCALGREKGASASLHLFQEITISLTTDYIEKQVALPKSFEDILSVRQLAFGHPIYIENLNKLTTVPGAPLIQRKAGELNGSYAHRLFAIARRSDDDFPKIGRRVIVIRQADLSCITVWIPESEAQFILHQLKDFDPAKQPLAFQDFSSEKGQGPPDRNVRDSSHAIPSDGKAGATAPSLQKGVTPAAESMLTKNVTSWLAGLLGLLVILLGYLGWRYFRKKA